MVHPECHLNDGRPCKHGECVACALVDIAGTLSNITTTLQAIYFALEGADRDNKNPDSSEDLSDRTF